MQHALSSWGSSAVGFSFAESQAQQNHSHVTHTHTHTPWDEHTYIWILFMVVHTLSEFVKYAWLTLLKKFSCEICLRFYLQLVAFTSACAWFDYQVLIWFKCTAIIGLSFWRSFNVQRVHQCGIFFNNYVQMGKVIALAARKSIINDIAGVRADDRSTLRNIALYEQFTLGSQGKRNAKEKFSTQLNASSGQRAASSGKCSWTKLKKN